VKTGTHFEKGAKATRDTGSADPWSRTARKDFQEGAVARPIEVDDADVFAAGDVGRCKAQKVSVATFSLGWRL